MIKAALLAGKNMDLYTCTVTFVLVLMIDANALPHDQPKPEPTPCCLPEQFEADVGLTQGVVVGKPGARYPFAQQGLMRLSLDYKNKRQAYTMNLTVTPPGMVIRQRGISDFAKKITYVIEDQGRKCTKKPLLFNITDNCLSADAFFGAYYTGYGDSKQEQKAYAFHQSSAGINVNVTVAVTAKECYPVSQSLIGMYAPGMDITQGLGYTNMELGIKDPTVFDLPPSCMNATMSPTGSMFIM